MKRPSSLVTRYLDLVMRRCSIEPRDQIFVKGYGYLSLDDKSLGKNLKGKYCPGMLAAHQKRLDNTEQSALDAYKAPSKREFKKNSRDKLVILVVIRTRAQVVQ